MLLFLFLLQSISLVREIHLEKSMSNWIFDFLFFDFQFQKKN